MEKREALFAAPNEARAVAIEDLRVGDHVVERDGYALEITKVIGDSDSTVTLFLKSTMQEGILLQLKRGKYVMAVTS